MTTAAAPALFDLRPTDIAGGLFDLLTDTTPAADVAAPTVEDTVTEPAPQFTADELSGRNTYVTTLSDGTVAARSSATMAYTHAVEACRGGKHFVWSWHKTQRAAVKACNDIARHGVTAHAVAVVEVTAYPYSSPQAKAARAAGCKK